MTGSVFADWLEKKYLAYQMEHGRTSIRKWAEWLGIDHATVINMLNAKQRPGIKTLPLLASKLGYEIYDVMEITRPNVREVELLAKYRALPEGDQDALIDWIDEFLRAHGYEKIYDSAAIRNAVNDHPAHPNNMDRPSHPPDQNTVLS